MASDEIASVQFRLRGAAFAPSRLDFQGEEQPDRELSVLRDRIEVPAGEGPREEDARPDRGANGFEYPSPLPSLPRPPVPPSELPEIQTDAPAGPSFQILGSDSLPIQGTDPGDEPDTIPNARKESERDPAEVPAAARLDQKAVEALVLADTTTKRAEPGPKVNEHLAGDVVDVRG